MFVIVNVNVVKLFNFKTLGFDNVISNFQNHLITFNDVLDMERTETSQTPLGEYFFPIGTSYRESFEEILVALTEK